MRTWSIWSILGASLLISFFANAQIIIDHTCTNLDAIPADAITQAKASLHIAYGHTSHGSQLTTGMEGLVGQSTLVGYKGDIYAFSNGGADDTLDLRDYYGSFPGGAQDLGNPDFTTWATATRDYLNDPANAAINVIIWSWCGQVSWASESDIDTYLSLMDGLEEDFPNVRFVYMTGHRDYGSDASLKANNQRIRDYCTQNSKILYDFADIESYNPDGQYFEFASDACDYYNASGDHLGNWAQEWQTSHDEDIYWYSCESAHSEPLNANRKAYAAWWLWARLGGWSPGGGEPFTFSQVPEGQYCQQGDPLTLHVAVTDAQEPIQYQWIKDGSEIDGQTTDTLDITALGLSDQGWYSCRVTDASPATRETPPVYIHVAAAGSMPTAAGTGLWTLSFVFLAGGLLYILRRNRTGTC